MSPTNSEISVTRASEQPGLPRHVALRWAQRLKRVFGIEIESCGRCGAGLKIVASIEDPAVIARILAHRYCTSDRPQEQRVLHAARAPPGGYRQDERTPCTGATGAGRRVALDDRGTGDDGRRRRHRALSDRGGQPIQGRWRPSAHRREAGRPQAAARWGWQGRLKVLSAPRTWRSRSVSASRQPSPYSALPIRASAISESHDRWPSMVSGRVRGRAIHRGEYVDRVVARLGLS